MEKIWTILPDFKAESTLQEALKIPLPLAIILHQRNIRSFEEARNYFNPSLDHLHDFWLMKNMEKAVTRIHTALENNEKILIYGDYDVDGTTSVACMYQFLTEIYNEDFIDFYIPNRYKEGYGIGIKGIEYAIENDFDLIISLDCGIKSYELIKIAKDVGIDFIVCDHHLPEDELPPAFAILNPKQSDCNYPYKDLCGCGIGFKLICALAERLGISKEYPFKYLDLVATAIAADIVPMTGENRILAFHGLRKINNSPSPGIAAICETAKAIKPLTITDVVFIVAPRINAAGRMDDARKAVQLFNCKEKDEALKYAELLNTDNTERKKVDKSITLEAAQIIENDQELILKKTSVLYNEEWNKGVVGIVASRLIEKFYRPTIVLTKSGDVITGSARSVPGFNLYEAIHGCREHLLAYGGHFAAAGLTLLPEKIIDLAIRFEQIVSDTIDPEMLIPKIIIDSEVNFSELTPAFYRIVCRMEPFGPDNMKPIFITRNVFDNGYSKLVKEEHLKLNVSQNGCDFSGIGFNLREDIKLIVAGKIITGFHMARAIAFGADGCNSARAMMLAVGCIQALQCNLNTCPTGVATQNASLVKGLVVEDKAPRAKRYHEATIHSFLELVAAAGLNDPSELTRGHISKRMGLTEVKTFEEIYPPIEPGSLLDINTIPESYKKFFQLTRIMK